MVLEQYKKSASVQYKDHCCSIRVKEQAPCRYAGQLFVNSIMDLGIIKKDHGLIAKVDVCTWYMSAFGIQSQTKKW